MIRRGNRSPPLILNIMNRSQRRKKAKNNKSKGTVKQALEITHSIAKMVAAGAMKTDFEAFGLYINVELFWNKPDPERRNFARHMLTYFNMNAGLLDENEHDQLDIFDIDTNTHLATYSKELGLQYQS